MSKPPAPAWPARPPEPWPSPQACLRGFDTPSARSSRTATQPPGTGFPRPTVQRPRQGRWLSPLVRWLSSARDEGAGACRNLPHPRGQPDHRNRGQVHRRAYVVSTRRRLVPHRRLLNQREPPPRWLSRPVRWLIPPARWLSSARDEGAGACRNHPHPRGQPDHQNGGQVHRHPPEVSTRRRLVPRRRLLNHRGSGSRAG